MKTAIQTLREELHKVLSAQMECVNDYGIVKTFAREKYIILTRKARAIKESMDFLNAQGIGN